MNQTSIPQPHPTGHLPSSTISEFCIRHRLGRTTYFKMRKAGVGPKELRHGSVVRITADSEREWLERMQSATSPHVR